MSMNLHCNQIELKQTPTYITNMCMVQSDGVVSWKVTGKEAKRALRIYLHWYSGILLDKAFKSEEEANWTRNCLEEERKRIGDIINNKKLEVYIQ